MTSTQIVPAIVVPLVVWRVYVRVRRNIGRQPLQPKRLKVRIAIFSVVLGVVALGSVLVPPSLLGLAAGVAASALLAWAGVRLTRFERTGDGDFYTPNTIIGVLLSLLLVGRLVYRFIVFRDALTAGQGPTPPVGSPLTLAILGLTFGYYVAYYLGVLSRAKSLAVKSEVSRDKYQGTEGK